MFYYQPWLLVVIPESIIDTNINTVSRHTMRHDSSRVVNRLPKTTQDLVSLLDTLVDPDHDDPGLRGLPHT